MQQLSKSGMAYSPVAASTIGNAYGNLSSGIGEYLNNQANSRATNAIQAGLGINPMSFLSPYANLGAAQSNQQGTFDMQANMQNANAQYTNSLANYNQGMSQNGAIGSLVGGFAGGAFGGPQGAMMGANMGGSIFGGGGQGMNMGQAFQGASGLPNSWSSILGQGGGGGQGGNGVQFVNNAMNSQNGSAGNGLMGSMSNFGGF